MLAASPRSDVTDSLDTGIARALNMQIRRLAGMLPGGLEHEYGFSCECGCSEIVRLPAAEFDVGHGAWLEGHQAGEKPE
jgi:hypothetical protein